MGYVLGYVFVFIFVIMETNYAIGIDLGGTNIKGVIIDSQGNILEKERMETADESAGSSSGENWKRTIAEMVAHLKSRLAISKLPIGLSAPGLTNKEHSAISFMPGRLQGLEGFHWGRFLKVEELPVLNDAHAALLAESRLGAGKDIQNLVLLTLGTGIGGGLLINGQLHQGFLQRAGHLGHISLHAHSTIPGITNIPGSLENAVGNATLKQRSFGRFETSKALVEAYEKGDHFAAFIWLQTVKDLAIGICSIGNAISPEAVILSGGITKAGKNLLRPLEAFMEVFEWRPGGECVPVKIARFGQFAGAIGAAIYALQQKPA